MLNTNLSPAPVNSPAVNPGAALAKPVRRLHGVAPTLLLAILRL